MGIDIYAEWTGMTQAERAAQFGCCGVGFGHVGYLREAVPGQPYATLALVPEAFQGDDRVPVYAEKLEERLPAALEIAERREREIYGVSDQAEINRVLKSYRDFVSLCTRKEAETGEPCLIIANF
jgi:hypothetical protein